MEVFVDLLMNGFRLYDRQLRNDLLVIATLLAENPAAPMIVSISVMFQRLITSPLLLYSQYSATLVF